VWWTKIPEKPRAVVIQRKQIPHLQMGEKSYIICTSPGDGSTLLFQLLTNTNIAGVPNPCFYKTSIANWLEVLGIAPNSLSKRSEPLEAILKKRIKPVWLPCDYKAAVLIILWNNSNFCIPNSTEMCID